MNLCEYLTTQTANIDNNKNVLEFYNQDLQQIDSYNHNQFNNKIKQFAKVFEVYNFAFQTRVAIQLGNGPELVFSFLGAISQGLIPILLSTSLSDEEVIFIINHAQVVAFLNDKTKIEKARLQKKPLFIDILSFISEVKENAKNMPCPVKKKDAAYIVYTSGTTGTARGVIHSHDVIEGRKSMIQGWTDIQQNDRVLHAGKLNWTYTLGVGLFDPICQGATALLYIGQGSPNIWPKLIEKTRASIFAAVPSLYRRILKYNAPSDFKSLQLRHALSAGEKLSNQIRLQWRQKVGTEIYEALGMSEISTYISNSVNTGIVSESSGMIQEGRRIKLLPLHNNSSTSISFGTTGNIAVHIDDPGFMLGYVEAKRNTHCIPKKMLRGDWFLTGDLASMDKNGNIFYKGRNDDILNIFGYRIHVQEIESKIMQWEFCEDVAVWFLQEKEDLNLLVAWIVLKNEMELKKQTNNLGELHSMLICFLSQKLAKYKVPQKILFVENLPRSVNGKLQRKKLLSI